VIDLALTTAPITMEERYGTFAGAGNGMPSLGVLWLAALARRAGYSVEVLEGAALGLGYGEMVRRLEELRPRVLGISATTISIGQSAKLAGMVKKRLPATLVVLGGPHATAVPIETLERYPQFDCAALGEGESILPKLLEAVREGGGCEGTPGLVWRNGGGRLEHNARGPFIEDLDALPLPAWDLLPGFPKVFTPPPFKVRRTPVASLITSRGCPYRCTFCDTAVFGRRVRWHSAEYVVKMMRELYQRYGVREFTSEDDAFFANKKRAYAICEGIQRGGLDISWSCNSHVHLADLDLLRAARRAGCWYVSYGIESGSEEILRSENKNITRAQVRRAVETTRRAGMAAKGFFMVGHQGETPETLEETRRFALSLPLTDISVTAMTPLPGTEIYHTAAAHGDFDNRWEKMNLLETIFVPHGLSAETLGRCQRTMLRQFYLRPRIIWAYIVRLLRNPGMAAGALRGLAAFLRTVRA